VLKKEITYDDPFSEDGEQVTKTFYFNLTRAEITQWEFSIKGGLRAHLESVMQDPEENGKAIMEAIEELIRRSYGRREGSNFIKNEQIWEEFKSSEPYSQMFWDLCTDAEKAAEFMNAVVPRDMAPGQDQLPVDAPNLQTDLQKKIAAWKDGDPPIKITGVEMREMDMGELERGLKSGKFTMQGGA